MIMLVYDPELLCKLLIVPKTRTLQEHLIEQIEALAVSKSYSPKLITLLVKALEPVASKRTSISELNLILKNKAKLVPVTQLLQKFEDEYSFVRKLSHYSLSIPKVEHKAKQVIMPNNMEDIFSNQKEITTHLSNHNKSMKAMIVHFVSFSNYLDALQYHNCKWKQFNDFQHQNLVPICNIYIQKDSLERFRVIVTKVSNFF